MLGTWFTFGAQYSVERSDFFVQLYAFVGISS